MEKRRLIGLVVGLIVLCAGIATALILWWGNREVSLVEKYPAVADGKYLAAIMWAGEDPGQSIDSAVPNEEFQQILSAARVKKRAKSDAAPDEEFFIRLYDTESQTSYSIELGKDRSITVARTSDLAESRTYWTDCDGDVFEKLYDCHLAHGGAAVPCINDSESKTAGEADKSRLQEKTVNYYLAQVDNEAYGGIYYDGDKLVVNVVESAPNADALLQQNRYDSVVEYRMVQYPLRELEAVADYLCGYMNQYAIRVLDANEATNQVDVCTENFSEENLAAIRTLVESKFPGMDCLHFEDCSGTTIQSTAG